MRLEIEDATAGNVVAAPRVTGARWRLDRVHWSGALRRLDWFDWSVLGLFFALSLWTLGLDVFQVVAHGRIWTGTDGIYPVDQMQYLAWIRSASQHFLISNMFVLVPTPADYFQPAVVISAGLTHLGVAPWLALLLWKPVAVVVTVLAFRLYVYRSIPGLFARRATLVLALFFASATITYGTTWGVLGDLTQLFSSWGYTFGLLALGLMVAALVVYDRTRERPRAHWGAGALAATAGLLHPWQGEIILVLLVFSELGMVALGTVLAPGEPGLARRLARLADWGSLRYLMRTPLVTLALAAAPVLYYWILGKSDQSWHLARDASKHVFLLRYLVLGVAPLLIPALFALRVRRPNYLAVLTRAWPLAAVAIWAVSRSQLGATPLHSFEGITLPLAILAAQGVQKLRLRPRLLSRAVAVAAVGALTIPGTVWLMHGEQQLAQPWAFNPNFIAPSERDALRYLAHNPRPGGVLTRAYLGAVVPAETGRHTLIGDCLWSQPLCGQRWTAMQGLFHGQLPTTQARTLVSASGARFLLADCLLPNVDLTPTLKPMLVSVRHFGCSTVYEVRPPAADSPALRESALDAALRASGR